MFARISNMFGANDDNEQGRSSPSRKADSRGTNQGGTNPMHGYNTAQCQVSILFSEVRFLFYLDFKFLNIVYFQILSTIHIMKPCKLFLWHAKE